MNDWYHQIYKLNCQIGRAFRAGDSQRVRELINVLDFIDPPQAEYARKYMWI